MTWCDMVRAGLYSDMVRGLLLCEARTKHFLDNNGHKCQRYAALSVCVCVCACVCVGVGVRVMVS